jgi:Ca2+-binding EF-hand superfamily protein
VRKITGKNARVAKQLFQKYDVDNSGTIDMNELQAVLKDLLDLRLDENQWQTFVSDELRKRDKDENGPLQRINNRGSALFEL